MNGVDYSGHVMAAQGYVSLQKSIGTQAEQKDALTPAPVRYNCPAVGQGRQTTTATLLLRIRSVFFSFFLPHRLQADQTAPPFYTFQIFPFRALHETYLRRFPDTIFDVSYLSTLFLETVISGGISTASNIYEYFGRQLKGLQRALDYA